MGAVGWPTGDRFTQTRRPSSSTLQPLFGGGEVLSPPSNFSPFACGAGPLLPREITPSLLDEVAKTPAGSRLKPKEVRALYARFRRLAPNDDLAPERFKQSMGMLGLTDDPFLPERMFQIFDLNEDGQLSFVEFATSLAIMLRGTEDEKLRLSFDMAAGRRDAAGISLCDFERLVNACAAALATFMAPSRRRCSREEALRLFQEIASKPTNGEDGEEPVITLEAYKAAVKSREDFLVCLGLESFVKRRTPRRPPVAKAADAPVPPGTASSGCAPRVQVLDERLAPFPEDAGACLEPAPPCREGEGKGEAQTAPAAAVWFPWAAGLLCACSGPGNEEAIPEGELELVVAPAPAADHAAESSEKDDEAAAEVRMPSIVRAALSCGGGQRPRQSQSKADGVKTAPSATSAMPRCSRGELPFGQPSRSNSAAEIGLVPSMLGRRAKAVKTRRRSPDRKGLAVHFGHENWNLVLSMMIGIRMSCGRSLHEIGRELQPVDFIIKEKFSIIPRIANVFEYAFSETDKLCARFVDYAPMVFQKIRTSFGIQHSDYINSAGPEQLLGNMLLGNLSSLSELSSEGKSGAFFYHTADGRYLMKTITPKEHHLLRSMLTRYYDYIMQNPGTLIVRFLGLHCLKVPTRQGKRPEKHYFVVMNNVFNTPFEIHRRYDLKGSWVGRVTPLEQHGDPTVALKDMDFQAASERIAVGSERASRLVTQLERDTAFLRENGIIDYSLLLGVHKVGGSAEGYKPASGLSANCSAAAAAAGAGAAPAARFPSDNSVTEGGAADADHPEACHQLGDAGGLLSSDRRFVYCFGIIDILTTYDSKKRVEHHVRSLVSDRRGISCVEPGLYAERFLGFMRGALV